MPMLNVEGEKKPLTAKFYGTDEEGKVAIHSKEELDADLERSGRCRL